MHEALRAWRRSLLLNLAAGVKQTGLVADIVDLARQLNCRVQQVDKQQFERGLPDVNHQGVALEVSTYPYETLEQALALAGQAGEAPLLLLLDHLDNLRMSARSCCVWPRPWVSMAWFCQSAVRPPSRRRSATPPRARWSICASCR